MNVPTTMTVRLPVAAGGSVTARLDIPCVVTPSTPGLLLAHGANNDLDHPLLAAVAARVARDEAALVLRFNFPYSERGDAARDPRLLLEDTYRRAYELLKRELVAPDAAVVLGGKSLGGRLAAEFVSGVAESGALEAAGLVVLGYPLHPPGQPDRPNLRPLEGIRVPSLFFLGTRDVFCGPEELAPLVASLPRPGRLVIIEGGDHSFLLPEGAQRPPDEAYDGMGAEVGAFLRREAQTGETSATPGS